MEKLEFFVKENNKLFDVTISERPTLNFSMLKTILRKKDIKVNDAKVTQNIEVKKGDKITIYLPQKKQKQVDIIFEDENIIIANKPQGLEVTKKDKTFLDSDCLEEILNATACHRLDKNTEGLIVFAKNTDAEKILFDAFKNHKIQKSYYAIVYGNVNKNGEILENYLKKEENYAKICKKTDKNAKFSKLEYQVINQNNNLFLLDIKLFTGRFHQIRAQLANKGIFVLGDNKYGKKEINKKYQLSKQQLCAYKLTFSKLQNLLQYLSNKSFEIKPSFDFENIIEKDKQRI